jgi:hypothetical protein
MKTEINVPKVSYKQKTLKKKLFVGILTATEDKSRIRIRKQVVRIREPGTLV